MPRLFRCCLGAAVAVALCGCLPSSQGPDDEQKEPYFLTGKARENTLDYKGAIEAFEKALEVNPRNASAHFELGLRYEKEGDYAAAIYHFERYLKLRPESERSQLVKDRILQDKMELSRTTVYAPLTQNLQNDYNKLQDENKVLRAELEKMRLAAQQNPGGSGLGIGSPPPTVYSRPPGEGQPPSVINNPPRMDGGAGGRSYAVKAGDTPTSIAKKYGVKVEALMAANPNLDPKRMKVGQPLRIPPQ